MKKMIMIMMLASGLFASECSKAGAEFNDNADVILSMNKLILKYDNTDILVAKYFMQKRTLVAVNKYIECYQHIFDVSTFKDIKKMLEDGIALYEN